MIKRIVLVVFLGLLCNPFYSFGQDSTAVKDLEEEKQLKFQKYFFKALSEKSIKNYQKAIENLELCNELSSNDISVNFEFSKNYLLLNKTQEAKQYINKALSQEPNNVWMLDHLVSIYKKDRDYPKAIETLKKVVGLNPKKKGDLVRLYYLNREHDQALSLMDEMEQGKGLSRNLKRLKTSLEFRKKPLVKKEQKEDIKSLITAFEDDETSFSLLKKLLEKSSKEDLGTFHKYSQKAIDLFPAQPYAYLTKGKSLQIQKKDQDAIDILESGIDFVIDNPSLESEFYETMAKAYDGLGNAAKAQEYRTKAKKLKTVK